MSSRAPNPGPLTKSRFPMPAKGELVGKRSLKGTRKQTSIYFTGDLNTYHHSFGHNKNNNVGIQLTNLTNFNLIQYFGPDFNTYVTLRGLGKPDLFMGNSNISFKYTITRGNLTTSDHLPIIIKLSTTPIKI